MDMAKILKERGERYGSFSTHAQITQSIKFAMNNTAKWHCLTPIQKEALEMIAHKIGRILNGDPDYIDSWQDIVGYTQLVIDKLEANELEKKKVKENTYDDEDEEIKIDAEPTLDKTKPANRPARVVPRQPHAGNISNL